MESAVAVACAGAIPKELISLFAEPIRTEISKSHSPAQKEGWSAPLQIVEGIHPQWLKPLLEKRSSPFLAALSNAQQKALGKECLPVSLSLRRLLAEHLWQELGKDILPPEGLPSESLSECLSLNSEQLISLCSLLAVYDLAIFSRQLIDSSLLQTIATGLTPLQLQLWRELRWHRLPNPILFSYSAPFSLHLCGLNRLSKALASHHPQLRWHVLHKLHPADEESFNALGIKGWERELEKQVLHLLARVR